MDSHDRSVDAATPEAEFEPHPFLREPHAMTLAGLLPRPLFGWRAAPKLPPGRATRIRVDPESEVLVWLHRQPAPAPAPLALIVHGLSGSADSRYVLGLGGKLHARGFHVARMNIRNCGGSEDLTAGLYCTAQSGDVGAVAEAARGLCAASRVYACGWSMGGNMVLKLAGELGVHAPPWLAGVAAVSPAMDLRAAQAALDEVETNAVYRRHFLRGMLALLRRKAARHPERYDTRGLEGIDTFLEWDERVVAPHFGFDDAADFYRRGASKYLLGRIAVPVCVVHAQDDPFVPFSSWRPPEARPGGRFRFHAPLHGGHCGFIACSRGADPDRYWAENRVVDFLVDEERRALRREASA